MSRSPRVLEQGSASERIRRAGITLFRARGYHGTSVRAIAQMVGVEAASLYHHFPSKQEILYGIFNRTMDSLLDGLQRALAANSGFEERLRAAIRFHVLFHIEHQDEAFISHSELRSLAEPNRRRTTAKRDRYEAMLREFLASGAKAGVFEIRDVRLTTIAILTLCSGVSDWFTARGRLSADAIVEHYADMVSRLLERSAGPPSGKLPPKRARVPPSSPRRASTTGNHRGSHTRT